MRAECDICGNDIPGDCLHCPFCGSRQELEIYRKLPGTHRIINIEIGKPTVEAALQKLERELELARGENVIAVTIIHGYGASGRGGAIRVKCREYLPHLQDKGKIRNIIPGEEFSKKEGRTRSLLRRLPQLMDDDNLNKKNKGITVVEL